MFVEGVLSIVSNIALFLYKYFVGVSIGSLAIIADAWHTLSDCISSFVVVLGGVFAKRPADKEHPFGHGRVELLTGLVVGVMLLIVSYSFAREAIINFMAKKSATYGNSAIIVMVVSIVFKEALAQYSFWAARKVSSSALRADAWHHRTDAFTSVIILVGIFVGRNFWWMDSLLSLLVSIVILYAAFDILKSAIKPLIGEDVDNKIVEDIKTMAKKLNLDYNTFHHFHIHRYGMHTELIFHIRFEPDMTVKEAHNIVSKFEDMIKEELDIIATIHIENK